MSLLFNANGKKKTSIRCLVFLCLRSRKVFIFKFHVQSQSERTVSNTFPCWYLSFLNHLHWLMLLLIAVTCLLNLSQWSSLMLFYTFVFLMQNTCCSASVCLLKSWIYSVSVTILIQTSTGHNFLLNWYIYHYCHWAKSRICVFWIHNCTNFIQIMYFFIVPN